MQEYMGVYSLGLMISISIIHGIYKCLTDPKKIYFIGTFLELILVVNVVTHPNMSGWIFYPLVVVYTAWLLAFAMDMDNS